MQNNFLLLFELQVLSQEPQLLVFTIPIFEPLPTQYYVKAVSDRWMGADSMCAISFQHLILPNRHPPHTGMLCPTLVILFIWSVTKPSRIVSRTNTKIKVCLCAVANQPGVSRMWFEGCRVTLDMVSSQSLLWPAKLPYLTFILIKTK